MSIIMVAGNKHCLALMSDGRVSDIDSHGNFKIIDENYSKIHCITPKVYILSAGIKSHCEAFISIIRDKSCGVRDTRSCVDAITQITNHRMVTSDAKIDIKFLVAGFNSFYQRELYCIEIDGYDIDVSQVNLSDTVIYIAKGDIGQEEPDYFEPILNQPFSTADELLALMQTCIIEAAKRKRTVNTNIFFKTL